MDITKDLLIKYGFKFKKQSPICGQDSWMGMDFWIHKDESSLILRGDPDYLVFYPFSDSWIKTEQDLIDLIRLVGIK
jgi:hypothetical protein